MLFLTQAAHYCIFLPLITVKFIKQLLEDLHQSVVQIVLLESSIVHALLVQIVHFLILLLGLEEDIFSTLTILITFSMILRERNVS